MTNHKIMIVAAILLTVILIALIIPLFASASVSGTTISEISIEESGSATWTLNGSSITGTLTNNTRTENEGKLTISANTSKKGTLSFNYEVTLTAGGGSSQYRGSASITSPFYSETVSATGLSNKSSSVDHSKNDPHSIENWTVGSSFEISMKALRGGTDLRKRESSVVVKITNLTFTEYVTESITFEKAACNYMAVYYPNAEATEPLSPTITDTVEKAWVSTKGVKIEPTDTAYVCSHIIATKDGISKAVYAKDSGYFYPESGSSIKPIMVPKGDGIAPFKVDSVNYWTWESACAAAKTSTSKTVVLNATSYTLPAATDEDVYSKNGLTSDGDYVKFTLSGSTVTAVTYSLPEGCTLLLPYASGATNIMSSTDNNSFEHANTAFATSVGDLNPNTGLNYTLTIPATTKVSVASGGRIVVGGQVGATEGGQGMQGATSGSHANLVVDGTVELGSKAIMSVTGYVLGSGTVKTVGTGATIYQPYIIMDWRGAGVTPLYLDTSLNQKVDMQSGEDQVSPFCHWGISNIRSNTEITTGNYMKLYGTLPQDNTFYCSVPVLIGDSATNGLLKLGTGGKVESSYEARLVNYSWAGRYGFPGKMKVTLSGETSVGTMSMEIKLSVGSMSVNTANYTMQVPYVFDFVLKDGTHSIDQPMALLPGVRMEVQKDAHLKIGTIGTGETPIRMMIFDGLTNLQLWGNSSMLKDDSSVTVTPTTSRNYNINYPSTAELQSAGYGGDAELIVDGTLTLGKSVSFGGLIQTNGGGTVIADSAMTNEVTVQVGAVGKGNVNLHYRYLAGMSLHTQEARLISRATGEEIKITAGKTYKGFAYSTTDESYTYTLYTNSGDTSENGRSVQTVSLNETIVGAWECQEGEHAYTSSVTTPATCTTAGVRTHTCSVCGKSYTEEIPAGHTPGAAATCTTAQTCTVCGAEVAPALGHSYTSVVTNPTCTEQGYTTYTCSVCGDSYKDAYTAKLGHDWKLSEGKCGRCDDKIIQIDGITLELEGQVLLQLHFIIHPDFLNDYKDQLTVYVAEEFNSVAYEGSVLAGENNEKMVWNAKLTDSKIKMDSKYRYVISQGIAAGEMMSNVSVSFKKGTETIKIYDKYVNGYVDATVKSVKNYLEWGIAQEDTYIKRLCEAAALFGGYAQYYYDVTYGGTEKRDLISSILDDTAGMLPDKSELAKYISSISQGDIGIKAISQRVNLDDIIYLRVYFELTGDLTIDQFKFEAQYAKNDGSMSAAINPTPVQVGTGNVYYVDIANVEVANWDNEYTITVTRTDGTEGACAVTTSVLAWANSCVNDVNSTDKEKTMALAMLLYNQATDAYFTNKANQAQGG